MLPLAGINTLAILLFAGAYALAAAHVLSQGAFLTALVVLFGAFTALWVKTERRSLRGRDVLSRIGRTAAGFLIAAVAVPALVLMPLFSLRDQLPEEAGLDHLLPGAMVILLASLALGALTNVAGIAFMLGHGMWRRLRNR
jgi:hypothetical protein